MQNTIEKYFNYDTMSAFTKQSKRMKSAINSFKRKNTPTLDNSSKPHANEDDLNLSEDENLDQVVAAKQSKSISSKLNKPKASKAAANKSRKQIKK